MSSNMNSWVGNLGFSNNMKGMSLKPNDRNFLLLKIPMNLSIFSERSGRREREREEKVLRRMSEFH